MGQTARLRLEQSAEACARVWVGDRRIAKVAARPAALLLIVGDLAATALAVAAGVIGALRDLPSTDGLTAPLFLFWLLPALAVVAWLGTRGRAGRRAPAQTLAVGGVIGAVASGILGMLLLTHAAVAPALAWLAFPVVGFALRALLGQPAALVQLRDAQRAAAEAFARLRERFSPFDQRLAVATAAGEASGPAVATSGGRVSAAARQRQVLLFLPPAGLPQSDARVAAGTEPGMTFAIPALPRRRTAQFCKSVFDVTAAGAALLFLAPLLIVLGALVRLDGGPVLFAHTRIGRGGRRFPCLKFRSMVVDADAVLRHLLETDPKAALEWAATQKLRHDPRITWIGRFLRKTSLDELPQLFNVIRREMSLVGPRPIVAAELARYGHDIVYYLSARPGITGLWQVSGRSDTSYAQRVALDIAYVRDWSLWTDAAIVARTIPAVLKRKGAV